LNIRIENVENLGSYEWLLTFDPAVSGFVSVSNGSFLGSGGRTVFCPGAILDTGSVRFGCSTAGTTPPGPSGAGVLATITFSALAAGTSPLDLVWVQLSDPLANDIPTTIQDGDVTVVAAPTATPTLTTAPLLETPSSQGSTDGLEGGATDQRSDPKLFLVSRLLGGFIAAVGASIAWYGRPRTERR
jgi:hypothetical protein